MIKKYIIFLLLILPEVSYSQQSICDQVQIRAQQNQDNIDYSKSRYKVISKNRLYFYFAPDDGCKDIKTFIIDGDYVDAYSIYGNFTSVMYFKKNGDSISGWVKSNGIELIK